MFEGSLRRIVRDGIDGCQPQGHGLIERLTRQRNLRSASSLEGVCTDHGLLFVCASLVDVHGVLLANNVENVSWLVCEPKSCRLMTIDNF